MEIPFVCKSESFVSLSLWKLIHVIPNFDIMRMYRFQRYMFEFRQAILHTSFYIKIVYQEGDINSKILILLLLFLRFAFRLNLFRDSKKKSFRSFQYSKPLNIIVSKFQRYPILAPFSKNVSLCEKCARNQLCRIAIVLVFLSRRP